MMIKESPNPVQPSARNNREFKIALKKILKLIGGEKTEYLILMVTAFLTFMALLYMLTGKNCFSPTTYQTYAFQAEAWANGRLDLEENYSWLEIAQYNGKYYCSFPPFPSYILFPFAVFMGHNTPDALILLFFDILALIYLYKIALKFKNSPAIAMLSALGLTMGTNMVFIIFDPAVWFFAQSLSFALSIMAIYYALINRGGFSLFLWACSVGCRPMQLIFLPVLLVILYQNEKKRVPDAPFYKIVLCRIKWFVPASLIAISYMLLNYVRFGSITEFGHNYLPEFVEVHKQFDVSYIKNNLHMLLNFPGFDENGRMTIDHFGNLNFMMVNTPVLIFLLIIAVNILYKEKKILLFNLEILLLSIIYLIVTMMHATMGGWHFGNRYTNDILAYVYLGNMITLGKHPKLGKYQLPFILWGVCLNIVGTIIVYNGLGR